MKTEYVLSDRDNEEIKSLQSQIEEIEKWYLKEIEELSKTATGSIQIERLVETYKNDSRLEYLRKCIEDIYIRSVPKIIVTAENEDEKQKLSQITNRGR